MNAIIGTLFCLAIPVVGAVAFGYGVKLLLRFLREWRQLRMHQTRLPVRAHITYSGITEQGEGVYDVTLCFEYTVGGERYTGCAVKAQELLGWQRKQTAENIARIQYPIGKQVTVHYKPSDPATAALLGAPPESIAGYLGGSCLFILLGGVLLVVFIAYVVALMIAAAFPD
jgi:hypothetical protein